MSNVASVRSIPTLAKARSSHNIRAQGSHGSPVGTGTASSRVGSASSRVGGSASSRVGSQDALGFSEIPSEVAAVLHPDDLGVIAASNGGLGDHQDDPPSEHSPTRVRKKTSKKMLFVWSLVTYGIICFLFFLTNTIVLIIMCFRKMHYFVREPDQVSLFDVIPNVFGILLKFLVGSIMHILLTIFTILILIGVRQTEKLVMRHQDKLMMWIFVLACIGEYTMFVGTIDHMGSSATIENGQAKDTLVPHRSKTKERRCFDTDIIGGAKSRNKSYVEVNLVRANLKWMVQVSCGTSNTDDRGVVPTWQLVLEQIFLPNMLTDAACKKLKQALVKDATRDCAIIHFLDGSVFAWLVLDGLGIWFCVGLLYLYLKAVVRMKPGRFSFAESTYEDDIEALKQIAARVHKLAERDNNRKKSNNNAEQNRRSHHQSRKTLGGGGAHSGKSEEARKDDKKKSVEIEAEKKPKKASQSEGG